MWLFTWSLAWIETSFFTRALITHSLGSKNFGTRGFFPLTSSMHHRWTFWVLWHMQVPGSVEGVYVCVSCALMPSSLSAVRSLCSAYLTWYFGRSLRIMFRLDGKNTLCVCLGYSWCTDTWRISQRRILDVPSGLLPWFQSQIYRYSSLSTISRFEVGIRR